MREVKEPPSVPLRAASAAVVADEADAHNRHGSRSCGHPIHEDGFACQTRLAAGSILDGRDGL